MFCKVIERERERVVIVVILGVDRSRFENGCDLPKYLLRATKRVTIELHDETLLFLRRPENTDYSTPLNTTGNTAYHEVSPQFVGHVWTMTLFSWNLLPNT